MREAVVNAARHAGGERIDVFAELGRQDGSPCSCATPGSGSIPRRSHRIARGLRESIVARIERLGGTVVVTSSPDEGTEVELRLPLEDVP